MNLTNAIALLAVIDGKNQFAAGMGGRGGPKTPDMWELIALIAPNELNELKDGFRKISDEIEMNMRSK